MLLFTKMQYPHHLSLCLGEKVYIPLLEVESPEKYGQSLFLGWIVCQEPYSLAIPCQCLSTF